MRLSPALAKDRRRHGGQYDCRAGAACRAMRHIGPAPRRPLQSNWPRPSGRTPTAGRCVAHLTRKRSYGYRRAPDGPARARAMTAAILYQGRARASAQAIPRGTDKPKPAVDQRKSPRPTALARLRHDGFGPGGRPVSRKGGLPSGRVPRLPDASCGCTRCVAASGCARRLPVRLTRAEQN